MKKIAALVTWFVKSVNIYQNMYLQEPYILMVKKVSENFGIRNSEFLNHSEDEKETFNFYSTLIAEYILTFLDIQKMDNLNRVIIIK